MTISDRLQELANHVGSDAELARRAGIQDSTIRRAIARKGGISARTAAAVIKATGCREAWLLHGEGPMFPEEPLAVRENSDLGEELARERAAAEYWKKIALRYRRAFERLRDLKKESPP